MTAYIYNYDLNDTDLNMYHCGIEDCAPGHSYGPAVRDHYLIHYVFKGKGFFRSNGITYNLKEGQGFLIYPWETTYYQADSESPWSYCWVGFNGRKAQVYLTQANLNSNNPIFNCPSDDYLKNCILDMIDANKFMLARESKQLALLYLFLTHLIERTESMKTYSGTDNRKDLYIKKAVEYIGMNFSRKISISAISANIGLDRSYLGSIFKSSLNISIQQFIINYRMHKASELLQNNALTIGDVSRSVGYDDPLLFSKMFKKTIGQSPREYRKFLQTSGNIRT